MTNTSADPYTNAAQVKDTYTLFTRIPVYISENMVWTDALWEKDLAEHLIYLRDFRLCCPVIYRNPKTLPRELGPECLTQVDGLAPDQITPLRADHGWASVLSNLLPNFLGVLRALLQTRIAHSGGAGWVFPLSYYILLLRPFLRVQWIMLIESSFWMQSEQGAHSLRSRVAHAFHGMMIRRCLRAADARIFTQDWYRRVLLDETDRTLVSPAVWVDADQIASKSVIAERRRTLAQRPLRLIFPARLTPEKGVGTVLAAIEMLEHTDPSLEVEIDVIGSGPEAARCRAFVIDRNSSPIRVRFLEPVPYGAPFFEVLRGYHAVIVANLQEEQPRIIFDAFAQGLGCIATRTSGVKDIVTEGQTALLFDIAEPDALACCIQQTSPEALLNLGEAGWRGMQTQTHRRMHIIRHAFLTQVLRLDESD